MADLTGQTFGKLLVVGPAPRVKSGPAWLCKCSCGGTAIVPRRLLGRRRNSCGCLVAEMRSRNIRQAQAARRYTDPTRATMNACYGKHVRSGSQLGRGYLSRETWERIVTQPCFYCGELDERTHSDAKRRGHLDAVVRIVGVDRVDNDRGYEEDNCVPCCFQCNRAKGAMKQSAFLSWARRVAGARPWEAQEAA